MYKKIILAAACFAGMASLAQADTIVHPAYSAGYQSGHLMNVARVFLGYDQFGRPVYGHEHLRRQIIGYDRAGRPVYGVIYNNQPVAPALAIFNSIVRPYNRGWNWGNRHWDRDAHPGYYEHRDHRDHGDYRDHRGYRDHRDHGDRHD